MGRSPHDPIRNGGGRSGLDLRPAVAAAALLLGMAHPAVAADPLPVVAAAKSAAILGGAPSRLQLISMVQGGIAAAEAATPAFQAPEQPAEPVSMSTPNIFGSTALPVGRTPFDGRWRRVAASGVGGAHGPWQALIRNASSADRDGQLDQVNQWVNARIAFAEDAREYGIGDHWATASQSLRRGRGDCEDYAIAKMQLLRTLGFRSDDLYVVVVRDLARRADHALLVVRINGRFAVLDNGTDRVLDASSIRDYRPIMSYNGEKAWIHGYRSRPVELAAAPAPTPGL